jgi:hypothetical protein
MKTSKTPLCLAAAAAVCGLGLALPAHAGLVTTTGSVNFDVGTSVSDTQTGGATTASNVGLGTVPLARFDAATGVLTGATLNLASTRTQTTQVQSTAGGGNGNNNPVTANGTGSSTGQLAAAGIGSAFGSVSASASCTGGRTGACTGAPSSTAAATNGAFAADASALNGYVGGGQADVALSAPSASAQQQGSAFTGTQTTTSALRWNGTLSLSYEYLLHAAASFADDAAQTVLDLDFGSVAQGSAAMLGFGLFNLAGADRVGLDLDAIVGDGDTAKLATDLAAFSALAAGDGHLFQALLDTSTAGDYAATYWLTLSDADVGAETSRHSYLLRLNLSGQVLAAAEPDTDGRNGVPEPGSLALAAAALGATGLVGRRRQRRETAAG